MNPSKRIVRVALGLTHRAHPDGRAGTAEDHGDLVERRALGKTRVEHVAQVVAKFGRAELHAFVEGGRVAGRHAVDQGSLPAPGDPGFADAVAPGAEARRFAGHGEQAFGLARPGLGQALLGEVLHDAGEDAPLPGFAKLAEVARDPGAAVGTADAINDVEHRTAGDRLGLFVAQPLAILGVDEGDEGIE